MDNIPQSIIIKVVTSDPAEPYSLSRRFKVERLILAIQYVTCFIFETSREKCYEILTTHDQAPRRVKRKLVPKDR